MPAKRRIEDELLDIDIWDIGVKTDISGELPVISSGLSKRDVKKLKDEPKPQKEDKGFIQEPDSNPIPEKEYIIREEEKKKPPKEKLKREESKKAEPEKQPRREMPEPEDKTTYLYEEENKAMLKDVATGTHHPISGFPFKIGRKMENDLVLANKAVSSLHAEIDHIGDKFFIKDVGSLNGTFVNGYKIPKEVDLEIKNNQEVIFANKKYVFHTK